jgi:hypothetical protein
MLPSGPVARWSCRAGQLVLQRVVATQGLWLNVENLSHLVRLDTQSAKLLGSLGNPQPAEVASRPYLLRCPGHSDTSAGS